MSIKRILLFLLVFFMTTPFSNSYGEESLSSSNKFLGEFEVDFKITSIDQASDMAIVDIDIIVNLPSGKNKATLVPIPAPKTQNIEYIIEPESSQNDILFGHVRPDENYAVFLIFLLDIPSKLHLKLKNVTYQLKSSDKSVSGKALFLSIDKSYEELKRSFIGFERAQLNKIKINKRFFHGSKPQATLSNNLERYEISPKSEMVVTSPIVIYLSIGEKQYYLYALLGVMGLLLGLLSAPKVITSKKSSTIWIIISSFVLVSILIISWSYLSIEKILNDTTTIVTIGTITGIFVGIIGASIIKIVNSD